MKKPHNMARIIPSQKTLMTSMTKAHLLFLTLGLTLLSGCNWLPSPYKIDIQQGNVVNQESLNLLKPGMPKRKVRFIMGTPLINDSFHQDRWDYFYSLETKGKLQKTEHLTLYFKDDKLHKFSGDKYPQPKSEQSILKHQQETVVLVHPKIKKKGWFLRLLDKIGLGADEYDTDTDTRKTESTPHTH